MEIISVSSAVDYRSMQYQLVPLLSPKLKSDYAIDKIQVDEDFNAIYCQNKDGEILHRLPLNLYVLNYGKRHKWTKADEELPF